jgi:hypothetical protein
MEVFVKQIVHFVAPIIAANFPEFTGAMGAFVT